MTVRRLVRVISIERRRTSLSFKAETTTRPSREEVEHCSPATSLLFIYEQTGMVDDHWPATRYSFYVLRLNRPGYMRNVMPEPEGRAKKWLVIGDEITATSVTGWNGSDPCWLRRRYKTFDTTVKDQDG